MQMERIQHCVSKTQKKLHLFSPARGAERYGSDGGTEGFQRGGMVPYHVEGYRQRFCNLRKNTVYKINKHNFSLLKHWYG